MSLRTSKIHKYKASLYTLRKAAKTTCKTCGNAMKCQSGVYVCGRHNGSEHTYVNTPNKTYKHNVPTL